MAAGFSSAKGKDAFSFARVEPLKFRTDIPMFLGLTSTREPTTSAVLESRFPTLAPRVQVAESAQKNELIVRVDKRKPKRKRRNSEEPGEDASASKTHDAHQDPCPHLIRAHFEYDKACMLESQTCFLIHVQIDTSIDAISCTFVKC